MVLREFLSQESELGESMLSIVQKEVTKKEVIDCLELVEGA